MARMIAGIGYPPAISTAVFRAPAPHRAAVGRCPGHGVMRQVIVAHSKPDVAILPVFCKVDNIRVVSDTVELLEFIEDC